MITDIYVEKSEEKALQQVSYKLLCWCHYVNNTFLFWPHRLDRLRMFQDHLRNVPQNI